MKRREVSPFSVRSTALLLVSLAWPLLHHASAQTQDRSPINLVKSLTRSSDPGVVITFSCGIDEEERAARDAAKSLVKWGATATAEIENGLDLVEKGGPAGPDSFRSRWLLYAYAKIEGRLALPRLLNMAASPSRCADLGLSISNSLALALGLTSYVPSTCPLTPIIRCRGKQPEDTLDQFVLAWEQGDRSWFEASLGSESKKTLNALLKERSWEALRNDLWQPASPDHNWVGYRFITPHPWSEPETAFDDAKFDNPVPKESVLMTQFTNRNGNRCGDVEIKFLLASRPTPPGYLGYVIDTSDLTTLLRTIASCVAH
jgi:hypothetical protein